MERLWAAERRQEDDRSIDQDCEERRHERNTEVHRIARLDPVRRQEQSRDSAAHRRHRLDDPERRQEEQARDTAAHRRVCLENTERRHEEQARDMAARKRACQEDTERR